jgi:hypothetical protein
MTNSYATPVGTLLQTTDTVVFSASSETALTIRFSNVDTSSNRKLDVFCYTGSGPGGDVDRITTPNFEIPPGGYLEMTPIYLKATYKIVAKTDINDKIVGFIMGIVTT